MNESNSIVVYNSRLEQMADEALIKAVTAMLALPLSACGDVIGFMLFTAFRAYHDFCTAPTQFT